MLLDLPPEILSMVLLQLQPDLFSTILMTSKVLRSEILANPKLLRTQLSRLPGLRPPDQATSTELLNLFNQRAAQSAWNGLEASADIVVHRPILHGYHDGWTRPRFDWIQPCCSASKGCDRGLLATASDYRGVIHVYRIRKGQISPFRTLDPRSLDLDDEGSQSIRYECIAMRWQRCNSTHSDHLVALFGYSIEGSPEASKGKFVQQFAAEAREKSCKTYHLLCWKLCKDTSRPWLSHEVVLAPGFRPIILTTAEDKPKDQSCTPVAITAFSDQLGKYIISIYQMTNTRVIHLPVKSSEAGQDDSLGHTFTQPVLRARFSKGPSTELWLYGSDTAPIENIPGCGILLPTAAIGHGTLRMAGSVSTSRSTPYLFSSHAFPKSFKGIPISTHHEHECGVYESGSKYCVQTALEIVVPRTDRFDSTFPRGAFLVKYAEEQDTCSPFDLSLELPALEYTVVAMLLGSSGDINTQSPLGNIIALSPDREWVAIAHWNTVKLWGINTSAFFSPEVGSLPAAALTRPTDGAARFTWAEKQNKARRHELGADDDKAYSVNCAQGYYHDHIRLKGDERKRIVGIRPIELPSRGVVFSMAFAKHNILWAWTDRGLVKWAWNKKRRGVREEIPLPMVAPNMWTSG